MPVLSTARQSLLAAMRGDQQVQRPLGAALGDVYVQGLLTPLGRFAMQIACRAMGRDSVLKSGPVQSRPTSRNKRSTNPVVCRSAMPNSPGLGPFRAETGHWPVSEAPFTLHRQTGLNGRIAVALPTATPACRRGLPAHLGIKPDRQRAPALERVRRRARTGGANRLTVGWPVPRLVGRGCRSAHTLQLPRWFHVMNPTRDLCNRATTDMRNKRPWPGGRSGGLAQARLK